jgi:hypothetical protein
VDTLLLPILSYLPPSEIVPLASLSKSSRSHLDKDFYLLLLACHLHTEIFDVFQARPVADSLLAVQKAVVCPALLSPPPSDRLSLSLPPEAVRGNRAHSIAMLHGGGVWGDVDSDFC